MKSLLCILTLALHMLAYAENTQDSLRPIRSLLAGAENFSATSSRYALICADSAAFLAQKANEPELMMSALKIIVLTNLYIGDYNRCIEAANQLLKTAKLTHKEKFAMYAHIGLGQAYEKQDNFPVAKQHLDSAYAMAIRLEDDFAICSVYNGYGIYYVDADANYYRAIDCYQQGIAAAERSSNERLHSLLLCNLSGVYFLKQDAAGLSYALECYRRGHQLDQSYLIFIGATNAAYCLFLEKKYEEALHYLREAELLMIEKEYLNQANIYTLYGNIHYETGKNDTAITYFKKALTESDQTQVSYAVNAYAGLGKAYIKAKQFPPAYHYLTEGLKFASMNRLNSAYKQELYRYLSVYYEKTGKYAEALDSYKMFKNEHDSLFNRDKEYHLSELRIKYETEKTQNLLKERDIALMKKERRLQFLYLTVFLTVLAAIILFISIHKRNKRRLNIVCQNLYLVEQEKILQNVLQKINVQENTGAEKYASSSLTEGKSEDLYLKLHQMMIRDKLYKDNSLTKERLANILDTNRAYLSQVINKHTGLSFNHYINRLRIDEVRRILSDPEDDTPLKAIASDSGFNNLTTFYNAFQSAIGMPPSAYRSKMREIVRNKQKKEDYPEI